MPFVLALDCCSRWTNVGCSDDGVVLGEIHLNVGRKQSALLPTVVDGLLRSLDRSIHDIDLIAVTTGPGYFTGLRVGISYALSLAEGINVPVVPVSTMEAMIYDLVHPGVLFVPLLWARRDEVYGAIYAAPERDADLVSILPPTFLPFRELLDQVRGQRLACLWAGEDLSRFASDLEGEWCFPNRAAARAGNVALLGERDRAVATSPDSLPLSYLRGADLG